MKKLMSLVLVLAMVATMVAGCAKKPVETTEAPTTQAPETQAPTEPATEAPAGALKTGLAIVGGVSSKSADAGEKDGLAQSDMTAVAVLVDANGVIVDCKIDVAQNKINFTTDGKVVVPDSFRSKQELKEDYNMKGASPIGKEWYEQAEAFAAYVIGKTADEVAAIATDDAGHPTDADITAGCTMAVGAFVEGIQNAVASAAELGAQEGDVLGLGLVTDAAHGSKDAGEKDGMAQADTTYVAATSKDGVVTSCIVDVTQAKVSFDATGKITSDLTAPVITKDTQKGDYGMAGVSPIGKEWFEQADAFEAFVVGKTAADIALAEGKATDADLLAGCTMSIGDFVAALAKATGAAPAGGLKTGLAVVGGVSSKSADAGEKDGLAQSDMTAVAVLVDANGVIVDCKIDVAQNKINFTTDGKVVVPDSFRSKQELKEDYNMKGASPIGKEWYEQAEAFAAYVIGKTADEVAAIATDDAGHPTDADITAGCTMAVGAFVEGIQNAVASATELGAQEGDKLGLGLVTDAAHGSKDAGEKDGMAQADTTYVAATSKDGVVTSCIVDVTQAKVSFDATGKITSDLTAPVITKDTQKGDYGMAGVSPIGKEWFEQADAFEAFVVGKTAADIALAEGKATDADLLAGCTMSIGDFVTALDKATK